MKKEAVHTTWIAMIISVFAIIWMTVGRTSESWSQNHKGEYDWLLYPTLLGICVVYFTRSFMHPKSKEEMFRVIWRIKHGNWNRVIAVLFACVLIFGVNADFEWVQKIHVYATAMAILAANIGMVYYGYRDSIGLNGAILSAAIGVSMFAFAYFFPILSIAEGEMLVSVPLIIFLIATTKID